MSRRAQVWSSDFTFSLIIFSAATVIAFTIIVNTLNDREYESVRAQAVNAAALLAGEGYPAHWQASDVLRAGIMSDDRLSMRKAAELGDTSPERLRKSLRITDNMYVYLTNGSGSIVPVFGQCGVGDLSVPSTARNLTLRGVGIGDTPRPIIEGTNVTAAPAPIALGNLSAQDIVIIEGAMAAVSPGRARSLLDAAARRGITFIVVGDPGMAILGIEVNATQAESLEVQGSFASALLLSDGETLDLAGPVTIPTIEQPGGVTGYERIAVTDQGKAAYATWIYGDARVWYIATPYAQHADGTDVTLTLRNATLRMVDVAWPECGAVQVPDADQVAVQRRTLAHHGMLLDVNVVTWRSS